MKDITKIILNLVIVFLAKMMIQMMKNIGHFVQWNVQKEAFAKKLYKFLFIIVIIDDLYTLSLNNINNTSIISIKFMIN